jgi:hypothetical protein
LDLNVKENFSFGKKKPSPFKRSIAGKFARFEGGHVAQTQEGREEEEEEEEKKKKKKTSANF